MKESVFDVIIVGAGFAGLSASYYLKKHDLTHVVFERGRVGESWRSQRWDSFRFNSTNKLNVLPGMKCEGDEDAFSTAGEFVVMLENYVLTHQLPVLENSKVISIGKTNGVFHIIVSLNGLPQEYFSRQVLIASGAANETKMPSLSKNILKDIKQLHASEYRNADELNKGAVLVIGGAQSGCQIAEDLIAAGRKVYLSTSCVGRIPRWYRGKDIFDWIIDTKFYDIKAEDILDPKLLEVRPPQISGTGSGRDSTSLQSMAKKGVVILGKMNDAENLHVSFQPNAAMHVKFADEFSQKIKKMIDDHINENKLSAPAPHYDEADVPDIKTACVSQITSLDLKENNITSIIWSTGFNYDLSYIKLPGFDNDGKIKHSEGVSVVPGLYFLGYPWMRSRKSPILFGIFVDVKFITDKIYDHHKQRALT